MLIVITNVLSVLPNIPAALTSNCELKSVVVLPLKVVPVASYSKTRPVLGGGT